MGQTLINYCDGYILVYMYMLSLFPLDEGWHRREAPGASRLLAVQTVPSTLLKTNMERKLG